MCYPHFLLTALIVRGWEAHLTVDIAAGHIFSVKTSENLDLDT